jgi:ribose transport system permease protein
MRPVSIIDRVGGLRPGGSAAGPKTAPRELPPRAQALVFLRNRGIYLVLLVLVLFFWYWAGHSFFTFANARLIVSISATTAIFGAALGFCVLAGALDISVPGAAALAGVICARLLVANVPMWLAVLVVIVLGVAVGFVNGMLVELGLNPLATTIGTLTVLSGLAALIAHDVPVQLGATSSRLAWLGFGRHLGIPTPVLVVAAVYLLGWLFLSQTRQGIRLVAVGGNVEAARRAGINSGRYRILGFVLSGVCAALISQANPTPDTTVLFDALTAVALSGMALSGGRGSLPRVAVGALIISTISNALIIRGVSPDWATLSTGGLLICALTFERVTIRVLSSQAGGVAPRQPGALGRFRRGKPGLRGMRGRPASVERPHV